MKLLLVLSLAANLLVAGLAGLFLAKKGGWSFVRAKYVEYAVDSPYAEPGSPYHESTYYQTRLSQFLDLPGDSSSVLFLGDSHVEYGQWSGFLDRPILNRGIAGEQTGSLSWRMETMVQSEPAQVVILTGANDARLGVPVPETLAHFEDMFSVIRATSSQTKITVLTIPPFGAGLPISGAANRTVRAVNAGLLDLAPQYDVGVVDAAGAVSDADGDLILAYSYDHLHMNAKGYRAMAAALAPEIEVFTPAIAAAR